MVRGAPSPGAAGTGGQIDGSTRHSSAGAGLLLNGTNPCTTRVFNHLVCHQDGIKQDTDDHMFEEYLSFLRFTKGGVNKKTDDHTFKRR